MSDSLLLAGSYKIPAVIFKIHDLAGINFSMDFIIPNSETYHVLSGFPTVSTINDEPSQEADLQISRVHGCPKATVAT